MSDLIRQLGRRVAYFRKLKDLTQAELAEKVQLSDNFIALMESGRRAPSFGTLERLMQALEVDAQQLFTFKESPSYIQKDEVDKLMGYVKDLGVDDIAVLVDVADKIKRGAIKK